MGVLPSRMSQSEPAMLQLLTRHTWGQHGDLLDGGEGIPSSGVSVMEGAEVGRTGAGDHRGRSWHRGRGQPGHRGSLVSSCGNGQLVGGAGPLMSEVSSSSEMWGWGDVRNSLGWNWEFGANQPTP